MPFVIAGAVVLAAGLAVVLLRWLSRAVKYTPAEREDLNGW